MKRYLPFVIVIGIALTTLGSGTLLYRAKRQQLKNIPESESVLAKTNTDSAHIRGNPDAPVTLEEFGDFQCPPCGKCSEFVEELLKEYNSRLRLVFRNFPLSGHEHAREAALAAHGALGLEIYSRVDLILDENHGPQVLEVNTIPGMTETSLLPEAAAVAGISMAQLCERIVSMSLERNLASKV